MSKVDICLCYSYCKKGVGFVLHVPTFFFYNTNALNHNWGCPVNGIKI